MGSSASKENITYESKTTESKEIILRADICASWGYGGKSSSVKELSKFLAEKGYKVQLELNPISGFGGKFNLIQITTGKENIIFSNNKSNSNAVIGEEIKSKLFDSILSKIN